MEGASFDGIEAFGAQDITKGVNRVKQVLK
jgi:hypothetical protein